MRPLGHLAISSAISTCIYLISDSIFLAGLQLGCGTLIDVDHHLEYVLRKRKKVKLKEFLYPDLMKFFDDRVILPFHSYELVVITGLSFGWLFGADYGAVIAIGTLQHLLLDQWRNPVRPLTYIFLWRLSKGFSVKETTLSPYL